MFDSHELPPMVTDAPEWLQDRIQSAIERLYHLKKSLQAEPSKIEKNSPRGYKSPIRRQ